MDDKDLGLEDKTDNKKTEKVAEAPKIEDKKEKKDEPPK